ncbi:Gfo/Idh/MocA family protein [Amycolatopsis sp. CA-161197]|uniref:Gfo/Idh/MocA family protein n=1 Tax=Amycolatopsis sp. CA-161197 TaxID=3239922 RepID=UPI003D8B1C0D
MKIIQVGLGAWGQSWLDVVSGHDRWSLAAVVDSDQAARERASARHGIPAHERLFEALRAHPDAGAVLVLVPPEAHAAVSIEAMAAGRDVLIEKPLAASLPDARAIVETANKHSRIAMVSQNYRFKRAARTVNRLITQGVIGDVQQITITYRKNPPFEGFRLEMPEPLLIDLAIHHFDLLRGVTGLNCHEVRARTWNPSWSQFKGNSSALVEFDLDNGARAVYTGFWSSYGRHTSWDGDWTIEGSAGSITWADNEVTVRFANIFDTTFLPGALERGGVMHVDLDRLGAEERPAVLDAFADAVTHRTTPETSADDNIRSLELVLAAVSSAGDNGVPIDPRRLAEQVS